MTIKIIRKLYKNNLLFKRAHSSCRDAIRTCRWPKHYMIEFDFKSFNKLRKWRLLRTSSQQLWIKHEFKGDVFKNHILVTFISCSTYSLEFITLHVWRLSDCGIFIYRLLCVVFIKFLTNWTKYRNDNYANNLFTVLMTSPLVEQPYHSLMEGRFDKSKDIIWGMVQHETEIYVRTVFGSPVNDIVGKAAWRLLIQGQGFALIVLYIMKNIL